jgi:cbb3-type cytochrome oxidase cytochrome c subunit
MIRKVGLGLVAVAILASGACTSRGKEVFVREGCGNCHRFRDLGNGGAPDLSEVGSRRDATWIAVQIGNPAAHDPATRMPAFPRITGFDLRSLVAFLRS